MVPAVDLKHAAKYMVSDRMVSPFGEQFLIRMTETTAAVCFQRMDDGAIIEGQHNTSIDDFQDKLRARRSLQPHVLETGRFTT